MFISERGRRGSFGVPSHLSHFPPPPVPGGGGQGRARTPQDFQQYILGKILNIDRRLTVVERFITVKNSETFRDFSIRSNLQANAGVGGGFGVGNGSGTPAGGGVRRGRSGSNRSRKRQRHSSSSSPSSEESAIEEDDERRRNAVIRRNWRHKSLAGHRNSSSVIFAEGTPTSSTSVQANAPTGVHLNTNQPPNPSLNNTNTNNNNYNHNNINPPAPTFISVHATKVEVTEQSVPVPPPTGFANNLIANHTTASTSSFVNPAAAAVSTSTFVNPATASAFANPVTVSTSTFANPETASTSTVANPATVSTSTFTNPETASTSTFVNPAIASTSTVANRATASASTSTFVNPARVAVPSTSTSCQPLTLPTSTAKLQMTAKDAVRTDTIDRGRETSSQTQNSSALEIKSNTQSLKPTSEPQPPQVVSKTSDFNTTVANDADNDNDSFRGSYVEDTDEQDLDQSSSSSGPDERDKTVKDAENPCRPLETDKKALALIPTNAGPPKKDAPNPDTSRHQLKRPNSAPNHIDSDHSIVVISSDDDKEPSSSSLMPNASNALVPVNSNNTYIPNNLPPPPPAKTFFSNANQPRAFLQLADGRMFQVSRNQQIPQNSKGYLTQWHMPAIRRATNLNPKPVRQRQLLYKQNNQGAQAAAPVPRRKSTGAINLPPNVQLIKSPRVQSESSEETITNLNALIPEVILQEEDTQIQSHSSSNQQHEQDENQGGQSSSWNKQLALTLPEVFDVQQKDPMKNTHSFEASSSSLPSIVIRPGRNATGNVIMTPSVSATSEDLTLPSASDLTNSVLALSRPPQALFTPPNGKPPPDVICLGQGTGPTFTPQRTTLAIKPATASSRHNEDSSSRIRLGESGLEAGPSNSGKPTTSSIVKQPTNQMSISSGSSRSRQSSGQESQSSQSGNSEQQRRNSQDRKRIKN